MRQLKDEKKREKKIQEKEEFMEKETVRLADGRYIIFYDFTLPGKGAPG